MQTETIRLKVADMKMICLSCLLIGLVATVHAQSPYQELRRQANKVTTDAAGQHLSRAKISEALDRLLVEVDRLEDLEDPAEASFSEAAERVQGDLDSIPIHFVSAILKVGEPGSAVFQFAPALNERAYGFSIHDLRPLHETIIALREAEEATDNSLFSQEEQVAAKNAILQSNTSTLLLLLELEDKKREGLEAVEAGGEEFTRWLLEQVEQMDLRQKHVIVQREYRSFIRYLKSAR